MNLKKSKLGRKTKIDLISKSIIFLFALSGIAILLLLFALILKEAVPAYKHYGFFHMYFSADFSEQGGWGIWGALAVTLITSIVAVLIALPIALRASFFIRFRMKKGKKLVRTIINVLAGVPSVVFGIFALNSLTGFTEIFGMHNPASIFVGIVTLIIMIFPTLVSMISNQLDLVPQYLVNASLALGNSNTRSLYKVVKKSIRQGIYVSAIVALGRAIGETMALSMILQVTPDANPLGGGLNHFLNSSGGSLGVMIARNMFSDSSDPNHRSALFAAGISLFIVVMILIAFMVRISRTRLIKNENPFDIKARIKKENYPIIALYVVALIIYVLLIPYKLFEYVIVAFLDRLKAAWAYLAVFVAWPLNKILYPKRQGSKQEFFVENSKHWQSRIPDATRISLEVLSLAIIFLSIFWIVIDVFRVGIPSWTQKDWSWSYYQYTSFGLVERPGVIANTMVFTLVLVILSILIALPFAFATAIYLSEYAGNKKSGKTIRFFLDSLGGTPSILFGLFGVVFFRQIIGLGSGGYSLIAGALTMVIVIIPTFTRAIEQVLVKIPTELRMASYSLGASKFETIRKVIIPQALPGMITGIILSAGRVIAETAPVYLTIGMLGSIELDINGEGWTMTTKILYNQIFSTEIASAVLKESYAIASAAFILITGLILLAESINPIIKYRPVTRFIIRPMRTKFFKKGVLNA